MALEWPVINPYSLYHHALKALKRPETSEWVGKIPQYHNIYWGDEAAMIEGNPMLALERCEQLSTLPRLWLQGVPDIVHDYHDPSSGQTRNEPERFVENYRNAGSEIEIIRIDQATRSEAPAFENLIPFFKRNLS